MVKSNYSRNFLPLEHTNPAIVMDAKESAEVLP